MTLSRLQIAVWRRDYRNGFSFISAESEVLWPSWPAFGTR